NAIIAQAIWSIGLTVAATAFLLKEPPKSSALPTFVLKAWTEFHRTPIYDVLFTYVIFGGTVLYTMTAASVFVLRRTRPNAHRPYRVWGYPATPLLYLAASCLLIYDMLSNEESRLPSLGGLGIILAGVPA